jgi:POT family proton-dependent oligopeptide transporter
MTDKSVFQQPQAATLTHDEMPAEFAAITNDRSFFGQPRGLATLFFTEMWERFSYYGIRPLLVLFMTAAVASGGFNFSRESASAIVGIYAASVYLSSLPGGWVADRWLGLQRAIWYGGVFIALGHLCIALSILFSEKAFFTGLVLIVIGTGLLKPNISAMVGDLYPQPGPRRDAGFSIFYMGINFGALLAPLITSPLGEKVGWHLGFGVAGLGMLVGLIMFRIRSGPTLGALGTQVAGDAASQARVKVIAIGLAVLVALAVLLGNLGVYTLNPVALASNVRNIILASAALYFFYLFAFAGLTRDEKKGMVVIVVLFMGSIVFWSAYEQAPTSLTLFARDFTDRHIFGFELPAGTLQSTPAIFVVVFAPVFAAIWAGLGKRNIVPSFPAKFSFALVAAGLGFFVMVAATNKVIAGGGVGIKVSMWWLVLSYLLQVLGELALSPVGLSAMTTLAPRRFVGQMMGVWFTSISLGNLIAGIVGGNVDPEKLNQMPALFQRTALSLFIGAAVLAALIIPMRKMISEKSRMIG